MDCLFKIIFKALNVRLNDPQWSRFANYCISEIVNYKYFIII